MTNLAVLLGMLTGKKFSRQTEGLNITLLGAKMQDKQ